MSPLSQKNPPQSEHFRQKTNVAYTDQYDEAQSAKMAFESGTALVLPIMLDGEYDMYIEHIRSRGSNGLTGLPVSSGRKKSEKPSSAIRGEFRAINKNALAAQPGRSCLYLELLTYNLKLIDIVLLPMQCRIRLDNDVLVGVLL